MIDIDRDTERRDTWLQYSVLLLVVAALLWFVLREPVRFAVLWPVLVVLVSYRVWAAQRFSPTLAQRYARAVVGGAGPEMLATLFADDGLRTAWAEAGAPLDDLDRHPVAIASAVTDLRRDRLPARHLSGRRARLLNRLAAVLLGLALGGLTAHAAGQGWLAPPPWPAWLLVAVPALLRHSTRALDRTRMAWAAEAMRGNPALELSRLMGPRWTSRREAVVADLARLSGPDPARPRPELPTLDLLLTSAAVVAFVLGSYPAVADAAAATGTTGSTVVSPTT
jgi:hypothetical protein